jgi:hypothetical protein
MELLRELVQIKNNSEMSDLLEELGNLGKLGLGPMVNAFKQTYSAWQKGRDVRRETTPTGKKFSQENYSLGKDSEAVDGGNIKNWMGLKKVYKTHSASNPLATIFLVDKKPVALMIGSEGNLDSINDKVALSWDFSKLDPSKEEAEALTKGLNQKGSSSGWRTEIVGGSSKLGASGRTDVEKEKEYDYKTSEYAEKFTTKKYAGFVQTVREIVPFINNLAKTFGSRLEVKLILADKVRLSKRGERAGNRPIDPKELKLFTSDIKTRLAKFKNSKMDTAEDAQDFVNKVFGGGLKKLQFLGSTYSVIPAREYVGSNQKQGSKGYQAFYNGTMADLISGKNVTMKFEADHKESDYNSLYLTVKFSKGQLIPVEVRYSDKTKGTYGTAETVKF